MQRWLKFVKYLPDFGVTPIVYTVDNPVYPVKDESLLAEVPPEINVVKKGIWEPNAVLAKFGRGGRSQSAGFLHSNPSFFGRKLQYIRANYFIPDARMFWIKPSVKALVPFIKEHHIDVVISTGPPHSLHLIAAKLKLLTGVKWLADFRDPWTNIDYFHNLPLTKRAIKRHKDLESMVLEQADLVTVVGKSMKTEFDDRNDKVYVLSNGFDDAEPLGEVALDHKFSICHIGMMNADRNPKILWQALKELVQESADFAKDLSVKLIGKCDPEVHESVSAYGLIEKVNFVAYMAHKEVVKFQRSSQLLLLAVNRVPAAKSVITGKVFEYLQSGRPIIGIGPVDGDLAEILQEADAGDMVDFDDLISLKSLLIKLYKLFQQGQLDSQSRRVDKYHRKQLTEDLSVLLKSM